MIEIKLPNGAEQAHYTTAIRLGDNLLTLVFNYLSYQDTPMWVMDILRDGTLICSGVNLASGSEITLTDNLPEDIGRFFFVGDDATLDNLGIENHLVWLPTS